MTKPNVLLIGCGGVGTIVAYALEYAGKSNLSVVVRRDYSKVIESGYELNSCDYGHITGWKPAHIYPNIDAAAATKYDYVIISTKNLPDVVKMEDQIEPVVTDGKTTIILIQNGFGIERPFIKKYPHNYCLSGVEHIGSHNKNGVITQTQHEKCLISYFENPKFSVDDQIKAAKDFIAIYDNPKHDVVYFPSVKFYRYRKLVYNSTLNTVCALTGVDTGRLLMAGTLETVSVPAMREVVKIAKADGVELPDDVIDSVVHSDDGSYFEPSMRVDVKKGNPIELQAILGNLLVRAKELKVETPVLQLLYNLLLAVQFRLKEGKGLVTVPEKRPVVTKHFK